MVDDATSERLRALPQQVWGGAAEHKETRRAVRPIREHPEHLKQAGAALDLVDDDQPGQAAQRQHRIEQPRRMAWILKVKVSGRARPQRCDLTRKGRFADLARPHQRDYGEAGQQLQDLALVP